MSFKRRLIDLVKNLAWYNENERLVDPRNALVRGHPMSGFTMGEHHGRQDRMIRDLRTWPGTLLHDHEERWRQGSGKGKKPLDTDGLNRYHLPP